jgi:hypothetical protein
MIIESLPSHVLGVRLPCFQHQAALVLSPLSVAMDIPCPLFCVVKQLHQHEVLNNIAKAIDAVIDERLDHRPHGEQPDPDDLARMDLLLESNYYTIHVDESMSPDDIEKYKAEDKARRQEGAEIKASFTSDPFGDVIMHHCARGEDGLYCCRTRADAVRKCQLTVKKPFCRRLPVPAVNRWIQLYPVAAMISFLQNLFGLLRWAYIMVYGADVVFESAAAGLDPLEHLRNESSAYHKEKRARSSKALDAMLDENFVLKLLAWMVPAKFVMHLHFSLFDSGLRV